MSPTGPVAASVDGALLERVRGALAASTDPPTPARVASALRAAGTVLGDSTILDVTRALRAEISGAGPLDALLHEPGVTDVLVNGPAEVWIDRGGGLERTAVRFRDEAAVRALAQRLAAAAGRRLDDAVPYVDTRLASGVRVHAVLPPVAGDGTAISLRVPARQSLSLDDLVAADSVAASIAPVLGAVVASRLAFLVSGGTGSGKTTVLAALLALVPPSERIVLVEDSSELRPRHPHVVRLEARPPNVEGAGRIGLDDLVRQALRMRPDRLVVGEVRGAEIVDLLGALNTGHEGGCGTLHANSAADVPARIEALGVLAGLSRTAIHAQAAAAIDVVLHLIRGDDGRRRLAQIHVVNRGPDGVVDTSPAIEVDPDGAVHEGPGHARLAELVGRHGESS